MNILDDVVWRETIHGHDGMSGAHLERARLADGTRIVVKRVSRAIDLTLRLADDGCRLVTLFTDGVLDRLPDGLDHAVLDAWLDGDGGVVVMRDVGQWLFDAERMVTPDELTRVLTAACRLHDAFDGEPIAGLCPVETWCTLLSPANMRRVLDTPTSLPELVLRGWERFDDVAPRDVADALFAILDRPDGLGSALRKRGTTMIHGDLWLVNVGLAPDRVYLIDWAIATEAPPACEIAWFLAGAASRLPVSREAVIDEFRMLTGDRWDPAAMSLAFVCGLAMLGWNKALDIAEHPDAAKREAEKADLAWWVERTREGLALI